MQALYERQQQKKLTGHIEMDDAHLGGEKSGKRGRGFENKIPFVAAVQTNDGKSVWMQMRRVESVHKKEEISAYANVH